MDRNRATPGGDRPGFGEIAQAPFVGSAGSVSDEPTIDLASAFRWMWSARWSAGFGALFGLIGAVAVVLGFQTVGTGAKLYNTAILLNFPADTRGNYPNGMEFAPSDLRSPAVLGQVYERNALADTGLSLEQLVSSVTVGAFSPGMDSLHDRFAARLADKSLTFEERKAVETEYRQQVTDLSNSGVIISMQLPDRFGISEARAEKIISDIPSAWASIFQERLGAFNVVDGISDADLIEVLFLETLDYPVFYDYLTTQTQLIRNRLVLLDELPGGRTTVSTNSGKAVADLNRELDAVTEFRMRRVLEPLVDSGVARTPAVTANSYRHMIRSAEIEMKVTKDRSNAVATVVDESRTASAPANASVPEGGVVPSVPQFDGSFVDRIMELTVRGEWRAYREALLDKKLAIDNAGVSVGERMERLRARAAAIEAYNPTAVAAAGQMKQFEDVAREVMASLNTIWKDAGQIAGQMNSRQLNLEKLLYRPVGPGGSLRVADQQPLLTVQNLAFVVATTLFGLMIGLLAANRRRRPV